MTLADYSAPRIPLVEAELERALPSPAVPPQNLHKAMRYSALAPGKRIRPLLCIAASEACGAAAERVLPTACALECIHAFSLIHDDLPAIDNDDLRRGRPTCHVAFGEAMAILAGDALFALAFQLIAANAPLAGAEATVRVLELVAGASGTFGMVGGQVADIEAESRPPDAGTVQYIHAKKTGALIRASAVAGGVLAGASSQALAALSDFGEAIGHAFQVADDVLNATGDETTLGKPVGSDAALHKATYVAVYGVEEARRRAAELLGTALSALSDFGASADPLRLLARYTVERDV